MWTLLQSGFKIKSNNSLDFDTKIYLTKICHIHSWLYIKSAHFRQPLNAQAPTRILYASVRGRVSRLSLSSGYSWLHFFVVCLLVLIFGGKFGHSWHVDVSGLWPHNSATVNLHVSMASNSNLTEKTVPPTEANKPHAPSAMYTVFISLLLSLATKLIKLIN